jgi:hypothetical protein
MFERLLKVFYAIIFIQEIKCMLKVAHNNKRGYESV